MKNQNNHLTMNVKGEPIMTNTPKKRKHFFKTRLVALLLSFITAFSVCAASFTTKAKAEETDYMKKALTVCLNKGFGYIGGKALGIAGPELIKMGFGPILELTLGYKDDGPSNQDVIDSIEKSTEEIKAEIANVLNEVKELSIQTNSYHQLEMNQLKSINSNIDSKDFRTQADIVAGDFAHAFKRIEENKDNFTTDGSGKINNTTYKAYKEILSDPKCNISTLQSNFDEMLRYLKGERTSNNNENGYKQLTKYMMEKVVAADLNEHSFTKTPDYAAAISALEAEIRTMEEHALLDYAIINALNSMAFRVKEYEIDNGIITVNPDESPYAKFENVATNLHNSMIEMNNIFTEVLNENKSLSETYVIATLTVYDNGKTITKGCKSFIDAYSQGIDSGKDFEVKCNTWDSKVNADPKKGFKLDENVKGINSKGGFEIPEGRTVTLDMTGWGNGFDTNTKNDMAIFTVNSNAVLNLKHVNMKGGTANILIPDNATNAKVYVTYSDFDECTNGVLISKNAKNSTVTLDHCEFWYSCKTEITVQSSTSSVQENECYHSKAKEVRGNEYWGT